MKIWHISDTHGHHRLLKPPKDIDMVIHSGDATNYRDPYRNEPEMRDFLTWFYKLNVKYKIFVAGNHDSSIEKTLVHPEDIKNLGIEYLYMDSINIEGFKIWGSPYVPRYGDWSFMKPREKMMSKVWDHMPEDIDILVTHTPPMGILDQTGSYIFDPQTQMRINTIENVGCRSLHKKVMKIQPTLHCFGHIHGSKDMFNAGTKTLSGIGTIFSNGSCCVDRHKNRFQLNGNIIELKGENSE